jgi:hypothetical protein
LFVLCSRSMQEQQEVENVWVNSNSSVENYGLSTVTMYRKDVWKVHYKNSACRETMFWLIAIDFSQKSPHFSLLYPTSPCELSEREVTSTSNLKVVGALDNYSLVLRFAALRNSQKYIFPKLKSLQYIIWQFPTWF